MNKTLIGILSGLCLFVVLTMGWYISTGNSLVVLDETLNEKWSQVENVYQRRADLIPNLVNTVKGYAKHEADVLEAVTQARASVGQVRVNSPADLPKFDQAQGQLTSALSRLMIISEKYPELKADKNFMALQSELEGTENRIAVERRRFIEAVKDYNSTIRKFPQSFVASQKGLKDRAYFQADAASKTAPKVQF